MNLCQVARVALGAFAGFLAVATTSMSATAPYEVRGRKQFGNVIGAHSCQELLVRGQSLGWINSPQQVSAGLIVRPCVADNPATLSAASAERVEGNLGDGWHVVALQTGAMWQLRLPALGPFSNPSFCGRYAAYWAARSESTWSLMVADLDTAAVVRDVSAGKLDVATDDVTFLPAPMWNMACTEAVFEREGFVRRTSIVVESNIRMQRSGSVRSAPGHSCGMDDTQNVSLVAFGSIGLLPSTARGNRFSVARGRKS